MPLMLSITIASMIDSCPSPGEEIKIGANNRRVIVGTGHSPEHACLNYLMHCGELRRELNAAGVAEYQMI